MSDIQEGLKRAEQYFLEMARGSREGEEYALAQICHRAADRIRELKSRLNSSYWIEGVNDES